MKPNPLKIATSREVEEHVDITLLNRSDILKIDWAKTHISGDKQKPLELPSFRGRNWRG